MSPNPKVKASSSSSQSSSETDRTLNAISLEYSFEELKHSTDNFHVANKIGQGAYGNVYRGVLRDGNEVAIKYLHAGQQSAGFEDEVKVLSKFRHQNLVILMGFSRQGAQRLLVYELLSGGDVGSRLQKGPPLGWRQRLTIALDAACGLSHLHNQNPKVFHRDIKSANILLDRNGSAKWGDFGLACLSAKLSHKVHQTAGTIGYADPKYICSSVVTENTEVYSFGWVLIELLTAKPPAIQHTDGTISYFSTKLRDPKTGSAHLRTLLSFTDTSACFPETVRMHLAKLALRCIHRDETNRPDFRSIVIDLRKFAADCDARGGSPCLPTQLFDSRLNGLRQNYVHFGNRTFHPVPSLNESFPMAQPAEFNDFSPYPINQIQCLNHPNISKYLDHPNISAHYPPPSKSTFSSLKGSYREHLPTAFHTNTTESTSTPSPSLTRNSANIVHPQGPASCSFPLSNGTAFVTGQRECTQTDEPTAQAVNPTVKSVMVKMALNNSTVVEDSGCDEDEQTQRTSINQHCQNHQNQTDDIIEQYRKLKVPYRLENDRKTDLSIGVVGLEAKRIERQQFTADISSFRSRIQNHSSHPTVPQLQASTSSHKHLIDTAVVCSSAYRVSAESNKQLISLWRSQLEGGKNYEIRQNLSAQPTRITNRPLEVPIKQQVLYPPSDSPEVELKAPMSKASDRSSGDVADKQDPRGVVKKTEKGDTRGDTRTSRTTTQAVDLAVPLKDVAVLHRDANHPKNSHKSAVVDQSIKDATTIDNNEHKDDGVTSDATQQLSSSATTTTNGTLNREPVATTRVHRAAKSPLPSNSVTSRVELPTQDKSMDSRSLRRNKKPKKAETSGEDGQFVQMAGSNNSNDQPKIDNVVYDLARTQKSIAQCSCRNNSSRSSQTDVHHTSSKRSPSSRLVVAQVKSTDSLSSRYSLRSRGSERSIATPVFGVEDDLDGREFDSSDLEVSSRRYSDRKKRRSKWKSNNRKLDIDNKYGVLRRGPTEKNRTQNGHTNQSNVETFQSLRYHQEEFTDGRDSSMEKVPKSLLAEFHNPTRRASPTPRTASEESWRMHQRTNDNGKRKERKSDGKETTRDLQRSIGQTRKQNSTHSMTLLSQYSVESRCPTDGQPRVSEVERASEMSSCTPLDKNSSNSMMQAVAHEDPITTSVKLPLKASVKNERIITDANQTSIATSPMCPTPSIMYGREKGLLPISQVQPVAIDEMSRVRQQLYPVDLNSHHQSASNDSADNINDDSAESDDESEGEISQSTSIEVNGLPLKGSSMSINPFMGTTFDVAPMLSSSSLLRDTFAAGPLWSSQFDTANYSSWGMCSTTSGSPSSLSSISGPETFYTPALTGSCIMTHF